MGWFSRRGKNVKGTKNRRRQSLLGIEQMEDRICLAAVAEVHDGASSSSCGVEDDVHQVSYACEDWDLYWGDSSTEAKQETETVAIIRSQSVDDRSRDEVEDRDARSRDSNYAKDTSDVDPLELTWIVDDDGTKSGSEILSPDGGAPTPGIEGSDIGSGG